MYVVLSFSQKVNRISQSYLMVLSTCNHFNHRKKSCHVSTSLPIIPKQGQTHSVEHSLSYFPFLWLSADQQRCESSSLKSNYLKLKRTSIFFCEFLRWAFWWFFSMGRMGLESNHNQNQRTYSAKSSDYKLLEEVGYGSSATVYRAIYLPSNEVVAVKCLDLDRCNSNLVSIFYLICCLFLYLEYDYNCNFDLIFVDLISVKKI